MRYINNNFTQNLVALQKEIDQAILDDIPRQRARDASVRATRLTTAKPTAPAVWMNFRQFFKLGNLRTRLSILNSATITEVKNQEDLEGPNLDIFRDILAEVKE